MARKRTKQKLPPPLREFNVWPERVDRRYYTGICPETSYYFKVKIWPSVQDFQVANSAKGVIAMCENYEKVISYKAGTEAEIPCLGVLHFPLETLTVPRVVSHECGHAAFNWARTRKLNDLQSMHVEEDLLDVLGNLVEQVSRATQDLTKN